MTGTLYALLRLPPARRRGSRGPAEKAETTHTTAGSAKKRRWKCRSVTICQPWKAGIRVATWSRALGTKKEKREKIFTTTPRFYAGRGAIRGWGTAWGRLARGKVSRKHRWDDPTILRASTRARETRLAYDFFDLTVSLASWGFDRLTMSTELYWW